MGQIIAIISIVCLFAGIYFRVGNQKKIGGVFFIIGLVGMMFFSLIIFRLLYEK